MKNCVVINASERERESRQVRIPGQTISALRYIVDEAPSYMSGPGNRIQENANHCHSHIDTSLINV